MYTLEDVRKEYDRLDALLGIDTKDVELKISKGFRTAGLFQVKRDKKTNDLKMIIRINKVVFECCEHLIQCCVLIFACTCVYLLSTNYCTLDECM